MTSNNIYVMYVRKIKKCLCIWKLYYHFIEFYLFESKKHISDNEKKKIKKKRLCVYKKKWEQRYDFIKNINFFNSKVIASCVKTYLIYISHNGLNDVKKHCLGLYHQSYERKQNWMLHQFLNKDILTCEEEKIVIAEIIQTVSHRKTYNFIQISWLQCIIYFIRKLQFSYILLWRLLLKKLKQHLLHVLGPYSLEQHISCWKMMYIKCIF